jgi:glucosamine kinase
VLAPLIAARPVPVAVTGSLACDPSFVTRLGDSLDHAGAIRTRLVEPALDPLGGAALMAYEVAGVEPGPMVIKRLAAATAA